MVADAERFAADDEEVRKKVESRNGLENFLYSVRLQQLSDVWGPQLKSQTGDEAGLGGKLSSEDKKTILAEVTKAQQWLESESSTATAEEIDEKREAVQAVVSPITSKLYSGGESDDSPLRDRDELWATLAWPHNPIDDPQSTKSSRC